jgi:hypothetical protein
MVGSLSNNIPTPSKWDRTTGSSLRTASTAGRIILVVYVGTCGTSEPESKPVDWAAGLKKLADEAKLCERVRDSLYELIVPDLSYLYRPRLKRMTVYKRVRQHIHQPCWKRGRWKSLT